MRAVFVVLALACVLPACSGSDEGSGATSLMAGAASRSVLPTVDGAREYLDDAPGWPSREEIDPDDPGVFVDAWDQGLRLGLGPR